MASSVDLKSVVKHIVDGTLVESLCRVCLLPFEDIYENIFTKICLANREYSIADVLEQVFNMPLSETDQANVCKECFLAASEAYKFYLQIQRSTEILNFYMKEVEKNVTFIELLEEPSDSLCITLPKLETQTPSFDFGFDGIKSHYLHIIDTIQDSNVDQKISTLNETKHASLNVKKEHLKDDDNVILIVKETEKPRFYKIQEKSVVQSNNKSNKGSKQIVATRQIYDFDVTSKPKIRRKRKPMMYRQCSQCPVKYRFLAKLKEHMKIDHGIDLYICKICKAISESELEYANHFKTHMNAYQCALCDSVFKRRNKIIAHLKWHEEMKNMGSLEGANVCEKCGVICKDEDSLEDHCSKKHDKKYTCYYCGKMYRGEISFEMHIKKHEMHLKPEDIQENPSKEPGKNKKPVATKPKSRKKLICATCGRYFVDERSLMWHTMLHTNERPYKCEVCGRGFVSLNRRNQHSMCAHTVPTRRCPLCPALFHLRSMVNTHIKKVHLKVHKRRNRSNKQQNVIWRTEAVPIQELSISVQNELLEMKTREQHAIDNEIDDL